MKRQELLRGRQIYILCEGETETIAVERFIRRQWAADGLKAIGLQPIDLRGKLEDVFMQVPLLRRKSSVIAVFTLIDLYEMKRVKHRIDDELPDKVARAKRWLHDDFGAVYTGFFYPHLSVHEVEAWLLAEGESLAKRLKDKTVKPDRYAENRNDLNPPSKRLDALFKQHRRGDGYGKIIDGKPLFEGLSFAPVY